jgi:serpin B
MTKIATMLLCASSLLAACDGPKTTPRAPTPQRPVVEMPPVAEVTSLATSSNQLAFSLWGRARAQAGNLALSPASISTALGMTWGGAKGQTADEMRATLHLDGTPDSVMTRWGRLAGALQNPARPLQLRIANRLFGERTFRFEQPFLEQTKAAYGAPLEAVDFRTAPDASRAAINRWVEGETERRIKDLLPPNTITEDTRMVLVNAIYFLADWASPFLKEATSPQPFRRSASDARPVPTMRQLASFRLAKADGLSLLELPYKGDEVAMYIALPDQVDGLAALEQSLDAAQLTALTSKLAPQRVDVSLPKFQIDPPAPLALSPHLRALGMQQAFDPAKADFTGIGTPPEPGRRLFISEVFHKTFIRTDEKGTEAAAATAVVMADGAGAPEPAIELKADHPFLFFIIDKPSGLVLFMGRVADPS